MIALVTLLLHSTQILIITSQKKLKSFNNKKNKIKIYSKKK